MRAIAAITLLMGMLAGCGQTGPLYMPGEAPPAGTVFGPAATSEPAAAPEPAPGEAPAPATPEEN